MTPRFSSLSLSYRRLLRILPALLTVSLLAVSALPARAQTCDRNSCGREICAFPARPAPTNLWGDLQAVGGDVIDQADTQVPKRPKPLPANRDATGFDEFREAYFKYNWFESLDIENGYIIAGIAHGIQIWDTHPTSDGFGPENPKLIGEKRFQSWAHWAEDPHVFWPLHDVDAPEGNDNLAAIVGQSGTGIAVFDLSNKGNPSLKYQNYGNDVSQVYTAKIGNAPNEQYYAFAAAFQGDPVGGLFVYNMSKALTFNGCFESYPSPGNSPQCAGVYVGKLGSRSTVNYVDGVGNYVAFSSGAGRGVEVWDVSNPAAPQQKINALGDRPVYGVAMWKEGSTYYLAATTSRFQTGLGVLYELNIWNVSCLTGACSGLGNPVNVLPVSVAGGTVEQLLTFSRSGSTPYLYASTNDDCNRGIPIQREYLFDVSNPVVPKLVGSPTYFDWYYRKSPTGFNYVDPLGGKAWNGYFYRAAHSIMDVHKLGVSGPPLADFTFTTGEIYPGTPVDFTDASSGAPSSWNWTFPDGTPPSSTQRNPQDVQFGSAGPKLVTLSASNGSGTSLVPASKTVTVLPAEANVTGLTFVPQNPLVCQPITFTAGGVTGKPPLSFTWTDGSGAVIPGLVPGGASAVWSTSGLPSGSYQVKVTVAGVGSASATANVTLAPLPALAFSGAGGAPECTNCTAGSPPSGRVTLNARSQGATEWSWDYGDGQGFRAFTNDPVNGPAPSFDYTTTGTKSIRVKIKNCVSGEITSSTLSVNITQTTPLTAGFTAQCAFGICAVNTGDPISFLDSSQGAEIWEYDWDGNGSFEDANHTSPVTSHTYTSASPTAGYQPKLRVRRGSEVSDAFTHAKAIFVSAGTPTPTNPSISVSGPSSGQVGTSYTFAASATNCTANSSGWSWTTGGGTVSGATNGSSIQVSWTSNGTKSVIASNSGCGATSGLRSITISGGDPGPTPGTLAASFTFTPAAPKAGDEVSFNGSASAGSPTVYNWSFGDGATAGAATVTHTYAQAGSYTAKLTVSKPGTGTGCSFGFCSAETTKVVVVASSGPPPPPPLDPSFATAGATCTTQFGQTLCDAETGDAVTFTATIADATSYAWDFGDQMSGSGRTASHIWANAGTYSVSLTLTKGVQTAAETHLFTITAKPIPPVVVVKSVVLPWIAQTSGAIDQSSDLYVHNPSTSPMTVKLQFRKRGQPEANPPEATRVLAAGETLFSGDVLREIFGRSTDQAGFVSVTVVDGTVEPVVTSFNTTFDADGSRFGQTIGGVSAPIGSQANLAGDVQHLVGLSDNTERHAYFGISNPNDSPATFRLRFYDKAGALLATSEDITFSRFGQKQFQIREIRQLGVRDVGDYRVEVETVEGGALLPYGANVRVGSEDPSFIGPERRSASKVYLIGALGTPGLNNSLWLSDVVLANVADRPLSTKMVFSRVGLGAPPESPVTMSLASGKTTRLANVLDETWGIENANGVLIFESEGEDGQFPLIQGESYDTGKPNRRFGQTLPAQTDEDAAGTGQSQLMVGLRQDGSYRTTFWLFNPSTSETGSYDVIYRALDGRVLGQLTAGLPPGRSRQFRPNDHPLPQGGVQGGFTVQIVVKSGKALSAGQVVNNVTNDPAYIVGEKR